MRFLTALLILIGTTASCAPRPPRQGEPLLAHSEGESPISPPPPEFPPIAPEVEEGLPTTPEVSLEAKGIPLKDALEAILEDTNWHLLIDKGVDPNLSVWASFKDLPLRDALKVILDPLELSYETKGNFLKIEAFVTKTFEVGYVLNKLSTEVDVGGDVLGGGEEGGESSGIKGKVSSGAKTTGEETDIYSQIETGIKSLLSPEGTYALNKMAGLIIISDRKPYVDRIEKYLNSLKKTLSRQVLIEAKLIEVTLSEETSTGIDWSSITTRKVGEYPVKFTGNQTLGLSQSVFSIGASYNDQNFILQALKKQGKIRVLSNPRVQVINGRTALISVGKTQAYWELTAQGGGAQVGQPAVYPEKKSILIGIIMGVTAYIHSDRKITLYITPVVSDIAEWQSYVWQDQELTAPNLNIRETSTMVNVDNEETIVIGGLITNKTKTEVEKVPILGDIPLLGLLFQNKKVSHEKIELVILLTPHLKQGT